MTPASTADNSDLPARVTFNLDVIDEIARKGIRRAAVFMGLGVNAAESTELNNYHLYQDTTIHLLPSSVAPEILQEWKDQFRLWVVSSGFREVVDSLCRYFDQIYLGCSIAATKKYDPIAQKRFERLGLEGKIDALRDDLALTSPNSPLVQSFYPIRNCLVHRLGRVGHKDTKDGVPLALRYRRLEFLHTTETGRVIRLPDMMDPKSKPFFAQETGTLGMQYQERSLEFPLGSIITISPKELTEILFFTQIFLAEFNKAVLDYAHRHAAYQPPVPPPDPTNLGAPPTES